MEHEPEEMLYPGKLPPPLPCRAHMCCLPLSQLMEALAASRGSGEVLVCPRRTQRCHPALKALLVSPWSAQGQLMAFGLAGDLDVLGQAGQCWKAHSPLWVWVGGFVLGTAWKGHWAAWSSGRHPQPRQGDGTRCSCRPLQTQAFLGSCGKSTAPEGWEKNSWNGSALLRKLSLMVENNSQNQKVNELDLCHLSSSCNLYFWRRQDNKCHKTFIFLPVHTLKVFPLLNTLKVFPFQNLILKKWLLHTFLLLLIIFFHALMLLFQGHYWAPKSGRNGSEPKSSAGKKI